MASSTKPHTSNRLRRSDDEVLRWYAASVDGLDLKAQNFDGTIGTNLPKTVPGWLTMIGTEGYSGRSPGAIARKIYARLSAADNWWPGAYRVLLAYCHPLACQNTGSGRRVAALFCFTRAASEGLIIELRGSKKRGPHCIWPRPSPIPTGCRPSDALGRIGQASSSARGAEKECWQRIRAEAMFLLNMACVAWNAVAEAEGQAA